MQRGCPWIGFSTRGEKKGGRCSRVRACVLRPAFKCCHLVVCDLQQEFSSSDGVITGRDSLVGRTKSDNYVKHSIISATLLLLFS